MSIIKANICSSCGVKILVSCLIPKKKPVRMPGSEADEPVFFAVYAQKPSIRAGFSFF
jgi:hypothetical protein